MENMFLRTVLRTRDFLRKSKTREKKRKIETKGLRIELELELLCKSGTYAGIQHVALANKRGFLLHQNGKLLCFR